MGHEDGDLAVRKTGIAVALSITLLSVVGKAWACDPSCPTCIAAKAQLTHEITMQNLISKPVIAPNYVCHNPNWAQEYPNVGKWQSLINQTTQNVLGGYMPALFVAAEMNAESGGDPNAIGAPVPNRALGLMQTLPPAEEQDAIDFGNAAGNNQTNKGAFPTQWPRTYKGKTPLPSAQKSVSMGVEYQSICARYFLNNNLDPAAIPVCYSKGIGMAQAVINGHNDYTTVLAGHPATIAYVNNFLSFARCQAVAPGTSTPYHKYP